jgi:hypothetical protein
MNHSLCHISVQIANGMVVSILCQIKMTVYRWTCHTQHLCEISILSFEIRLPTNKKDNKKKRKKEKKGKRKTGVEVVATPVCKGWRPLPPFCEVGYGLTPNGGDVDASSTRGWRPLSPCCC